MTERLYYHDSHLREWTARVRQVETLADGRTAVRLDRTAFYPTGGGQPFDCGTLNDSLVVECLNDDAGDVLHIIKGAPPHTGSEVNAQLDWARRFDHLQQHTAQHILSQAFTKLYDAPTRGFRMMADYAEVDVALTAPTSERIDLALNLANRIVWENRPVQVRFIDAAEADRLQLRRREDLPRATRDTLRIIEIEDFDSNACGGTHAKHTGEVGVILVPTWERAKGMTRLTFVAGGRAVADYKAANRTARDIAALFSVKRDDAINSVARLQEENKLLTRRVRDLEAAALELEVGALLRSAPTEDDGTHIISGDFPQHNFEILKHLAQSLAKHPRTVALLTTIEDNRPRLVFARAEDAPGDMNELMRRACTALGGRGGGTPTFAQGGGTNSSLLDEALETAHRSIALS